jgi:hypothetical protein
MHQANMTQESGEIIHQPLHIRSLAIPLRQSVYRKGMSEIVQPWRVALSISSPYADLVAQSHERPVQGT